MKENKSLKDINDYLKQIEYVTEKVNFLKKEIPDIKIKTYESTISFYPRFAAKSVNQDYTNLDFRRTWKDLSVIPYRVVNFTYNGKSEDIKIYSDPGTSRLIYITRKFDSKTRNTEYTLNFAKMAINFDRYSFNSTMLNACRLEILNFMKKHSTYPLNTKHLDPKLKNLMAFT
jgi:hypothetical protein